jgi:hypothetical protein
MLQSAGKNHHFHKETIPRIAAVWKKWHKKSSTVLVLLHRKIGKKSNAASTAAAATITKENSVSCKILW